MGSRPHGVDHCLVVNSSQYLVYELVFVPASWMQVLGYGILYAGKGNCRFSHRLDSSRAQDLFPRKPALCPIQISQDNCAAYNLLAR